MAFAGSYIRQNDYQTAKCLCRPGPHPLKKGKAVKEKNLQPPLFFFSKKLVSYLNPSRFTILCYRSGTNQSNQSRTSPKSLDTNRIRHIDGGFSFIPHRFLTDGFLASLDQTELLLYLFLSLVSDRYGLSFYSYDAICSLLQLITIRITESPLENSYLISEQVRRATRNAQSPTVAGKFDPALSVGR